MKTLARRTHETERLLQTGARHARGKEGRLPQKLLGCRFAYGSRQGIQATFEDPQGRVVPGRPHPVKVCSHRNTHNASQDYRLPLDCPFLGAFLAVHNTAITPISGSAGKNRNQPSTNQILASKPQVTKGYNWGLVGGTRSFHALPNSQNGSMRQIPETPTTPAFSRKETAGRGVGVLQRGQ